MNLTVEEINIRLLEIARVESEEIEQTIRELTTMRDRLYGLYVSRLDAQISALKNAPDALRDALKPDFLAYVEAGGQPRDS